MPNEYSVHFHDFITAQIDRARMQLDQAMQAGDEQSQSYWSGQLEELAWLRSYLKQHVDLKGFVYYR